MTWWVQTTCFWDTGWDWLIVHARTNIPAYPIMCWDYGPPGKTPIYRKVRGTWRFCGYTYFWGHPHYQLQTQVGDTIGHRYSLDNLTPASHIYFCLFSFGGPYGREIHGPVFKADLRHMTFGARVGRETELVLPAGELVAVPMDFIWYDSGGFFSLEANPTRLTIPEDGFYHLGCNLGVVGTIGDGLMTYIRANGETMLASAILPGPGSAGWEHRLTTVTDFYLHRWDYIEAMIAHFAESSRYLSLEFQASPAFWIHRF